MHLNFHKVKKTQEQAINAQTGIEVNFYIIFNLGARWMWVADATPRPGRFTPEKQAWYRLYGRLWGFRGRCERVRKILPSPGFDPRIVQPGSNRYIDYDNPAHDFRKKCRRFRPLVLLIRSVIKLKMIIELWQNYNEGEPLVHLEQNNPVPKYF